MIKMKSSVKKAITLLAQAAISITILFLLLSGIDFNKTLAVLVRADLLAIALSGLFFILASVAVCFTLYMSLQALEIKLPKATAISAGFGGQLLSDVTPARSGYFATPILLHEMGNVPMKKGLMSVMATGAVNFFVKATLSALALVYFLTRFPFIPSMTNALLIGILLLLVGGVGLTILVWTNYLPKFSKKLSHVPLLKTIVGKLDSLINVFQGGQNQLKSSVKSISVLILTSILLNSVALFLVARSVGIETAYFQDFLFMVPIAAAFMYVPLTFAGLGLQESVYVFILVNLGVLPANALSFALLVRILFTGTDLLGVPSLIKAGTKVTSLFPSDDYEESSLGKTGLSQ